MYRATGVALSTDGYSTLKADEGGFGPAVRSHREALELLQKGVEAAGLTPGVDIVYALDVAATHFFDPRAGVYRLTSEGRDCDAAEMVGLIAELVDQFPIASVEDALAEDDWDGWVTFTRQFGDRLQIVGDDLFTTNLERLEEGIERGAANAVLVKMNQIGTHQRDAGGGRAGAGRPGTERSSRRGRARRRTRRWPIWRWRRRAGRSRSATTSRLRTRTVAPRTAVRSLMRVMYCRQRCLRVTWRSGPRPISKTSSTCCAAE